jgi:lipopolysaccharide transport protein LptA
MRAWRWTRIARGLILVLLAGLVVAVVWLVADRLGRKRPAIDIPPDPISAAKVEVQDQVHFVEFRGDQSKVEAKFDRHIIDPDGVNHLVGRVQIVDYGKTGGRELRFEGEEATYDEGWVHVRVQGKATVRIRELNVESAVFDYDKAADRVSTTAGARISSPRFSGTARRVYYLIGADEIVLEDDVEGTLSPREPDALPADFTGRRFLYNRPGRRGQIQGDVVFKQGKNSGRAGEIRFELFPENENIRGIYLDGAVEMTVIDEKAAAEETPRPRASETTGFAEFISFKAGRRDLSADHVILLPFDNTERIQSFLLWGKSKAKLLSANGDATTLSGETIEIFYNLEGGLRDFMMTDSPRIEGYQASNRITKVIEGMRMDYVGNDRTLKVKGTKDRPAEFSEPSRKLSAETLAFYFRLDAFDAAGRVSVVSTPQSRSPGTAGFFAGDQPVFIWADFVRYEDPKKSLWMSGHAKMTQGRESLFIREMTILEETGSMSGKGDVVSTFIHESAERDKTRERRIEIQAGTLDYDPKAGKILYGGNGTLRMPEASVTAAAFTVELAEEEITRIVASGKVTVVMKGQEATGDQAVYEAVSDKIFLTGGPPSLRDKAKGSVTGEKLTFFLADGKIVVENRDGERALTVIK